MGNKGPIRKVTTDDAIEVMVDKGREPLTAREVAESLRVDRTTAAKRLKELVKTDRVATKKVGARARVYWVDGEDESEITVETEP